MFLRAEIERPESELIREVWSFVFLDGVVLDRWVREERPSKRHKWRMSDSRWSRLKHGNEFRHCKTPRPTPPPSVILEAVSAIREQINFKE